MGHRAWVDDVAAQVRRRAPNDKGWVHVFCPCCADNGRRGRARKLAVSIRTGWMRCFRAHCGWVARLDGFTDEVDPWDGVDEAEEVVPEWEQPSSFEPLDSLRGKPGRLYVEGTRKVPREVWTAAGLGYAPQGDHRGMVIMPVKDVDGSMVGWVGRRVSERPGQPKAHSAVKREHVLYNAPALASGARWVAGVEGQFGALSLWPHAVAFLGQPADQQLLMLAAAQVPFAFCLDGDAVLQCERAARELRRLRAAMGNRAGVGAVLLPPDAQPDTFADRGLLLESLEVAALDEVTVDLRPAAASVDLRAT
jgi:hypothetical protein